MKARNCRKKLFITTFVNKCLLHLWTLKLLHLWTNVYYICGFLLHLWTLVTTFVDITTFVDVTTFVGATGGHSRVFVVCTGWLKLNGTCTLKFWNLFQMTFVSLSTSPLGKLAKNLSAINAWSSCKTQYDFFLKR